MKLNTLTRRTMLILFSMWIVLPIVPIILWSAGTRWPYPHLLPDGYTRRGYLLVINPHSDIFRGLITSTVIGLAVAIIATILGTAAGRALGLYSFKGKRAMQFLMLAPVIVPALAVTMGIQVLFVRFGLSDTIMGVVIVHLIPTVPYVATIMSGTFANFDRSYEEQGQVLGANRLTVIRKITIPLIFPGMAVSFLFAFVISWSEYVLTLLVGGASVKTLPLLLFAYLRSSDLTNAAVLSIVFSVPPLLLLGMTSKFLVGKGSQMTGFGSV